ncbi:DUF4240 domain-containing protein [Shouchella lonarensis]|uniref:DUF4240 domain-containing protein n=1 Tax=Shouchella lonarensis TaxID=1464122 RepID=A0A1G6GJX0_9BACI|nr:DUF4240 domain-containing protein [Shouchella lonarensis]SDB82298.1 Protein of unknown function [Shouchella lonarensis]
MDKQTFWQLINQSRQQEEPEEWLLEVLSSKGEDAAVGFEYMVRSLMQKSYMSSLWGAAYVLMDGCSDDTFDYFRGWLIAQGEEVFNKVLQNHEYLAEYISEENLDEEGYPQNEELLTVGLDTLTVMRTGDIDWDDDVWAAMDDALQKLGLVESHRIELDWEEEDLPERFPRLWKRFGEDPLPLDLDEE